MPEPDSGVRSVRRALAIMALINEKRQVISIRDVTAETMLPKTTAIRLLQTLVQAGLLWTSGNGTFTVGPGLVRWAKLATAMWVVPEDVRTLMRALADECGETANLYVLSGIARVCVAQAEGPRSLRRVVAVGDELATWGGAGSKILLADTDEAVLREIASGSPDGLARLPGLVREIEAARRDGYAVTHGEREEGVSSVAAPVHDAGGRVIAALSVSGPTSRFLDAAVKTFAAAVVASARKLSERERDHPLFGSAAFR